MIIKNNNLNNEKQQNVIFYRRLSLIFLIATFLIAILDRHNEYVHLNALAFIFFSLSYLKFINVKSDSR